MREMLPDQPAIDKHNDAFGDETLIYGFMFNIHSSLFVRLALLYFRELI